MAIPSLSLDHGQSDDANFKAHDIDREIYDDDAFFMASFRVSWSVLGWAKYTRWFCPALGTNVCTAQLERRDSPVTWARIFQGHKEHKGSCLWLKWQKQIFRVNCCSI